MKLKNIKINNFGNLKNKEIEFINGINIVKGKNESGKSTLLKFIPAMFYGISKTKGGKEISDFDKYKPWKSEEFSGKITYELDNHKKYEVYRDFGKKVPKIYNENGEDITEQYSNDKVKGSLFFAEQTGILEDVLMKTAILEQGETRLNKEEQNSIIQKISNVLSTGNDNVSYQKSLEKLKSKQLEEIGTERTTGRPINVLKNELENNKREYNEINRYQENNKNYEEEKSYLNQRVFNGQNMISFMKNLKNLKENWILEQEKININKNLLFELSEKEIEIINKANDLEKNNIVKKDNKFLLIAIILIVLTIIAGIVLNNLLFCVPTALVAVFSLIMQFKINFKNKKILNDRQKRIYSIKQERQLITNNKQQKEREILELEKIYKDTQQEQIKKLQYQYTQYISIDKMNDLLKSDFEVLKKEIASYEENLNIIKLKISTLEISNKEMLAKIEKLPKLQENINYLEKEEEKLISLNNSINLARVALEESYQKMKENITPGFINNLSHIINTISDSKYKNIKFNDLDGLMVELDNGEYIQADMLSMGTIDQMYLSLRLSSLKEIAKENVPIILDEAFAYYDDERIKNIIRFLDEYYKESQIIIFTCNTREIKLLEDEKIQYNLVNL